MKLLLPISIVLIEICCSHTVNADPVLRRLRLVDVSSNSHHGQQQLQLHQQQQQQQQQLQQQLQQQQQPLSQKQQQQQRAVVEAWPFEDASLLRLLSGSYSYSITTPAPTTSDGSATWTGPPSPSPSGFGFGTATPTTISSRTGTVNTEAPTASPSTTTTTTTTTTPTTTTSTPTTTAPSSDTIQQPSATPTRSVRGEIIREKCDMSINERSANITSLLSTEVLDPTLLTTEGTSQYQARTWLDEQDEALLCPLSGQVERLVQRYRVAYLYFSWNGPKWSNCNGDGGSCVPVPNSTQTNPWLSGLHECLWFGLACAITPTLVDEFQPLIELNLRNNSVAGLLPEELFGWTNLTALTLSYNAISGTFSTAIGRLENLRYIDIGTNQLTGTLPDALYSLTLLRAVGLGNNRLTGTVSNDIGNLSSLNVLFLQNNTFSGPVPTDGLLQLKQIVALTIENNDFFGSVEPICDVLDQRRADNYSIYLTFFYVDCSGPLPKVNCTCCTCA